MDRLDLETCRAIGAEFPESEFVLVEKPNGIVKTEGRSKAESFANVVLANAPTCEELGEWLHSREYRLVYLARPDVWQLDKLNYGVRICRWERVREVYSSSETQARAESVKLILGKA